MTAGATATVVREVFEKQQRHDGECLCACMYERSVISETGAFKSSAYRSHQSALLMLKVPLKISLGRKKKTFYSFNSVPFHCSVYITLQGSRIWACFLPDPSLKAHTRGPENRSEEWRFWSVFYTRDVGSHPKVLHIYLICLARMSEMYVQHSICASKSPGSSGNRLFFFFF